MRSRVKVAARMVRLFEKPMIQAHVVGQQVGGPGAQHAAIAALIELPGIVVPMVDEALVDRQPAPRPGLTHQNG